MIQVETKKSTRRPPGNSPLGIVIHYSASRPGRPILPAMQTWAIDQRKSSTDFMIARDPLAEPTVQMVRRGAAEFSWYHWHCGGSVWPAGGSYYSSRTNEALVGVDLDNYGFLQLAGGEWCYRRPGFDSPSGMDHPRLRADRAFRGPVYVDERGRGWEAYTEAQIEELLRVLRYVWPLTQQVGIVGHEDIRRTKSDPGRAFDQYWAVVRAELGISSAEPSSV